MIKQDKAAIYFCVRSLERWLLAQPNKPYEGTPWAMATGMGHLEYIECCITMVEQWDAWLWDNVNFYTYDKVFCYEMEENFADAFFSIYEVSDVNTCHTKLINWALVADKLGLELCESSSDVSSVGG